MITINHNNLAAKHFCGSLDKAIKVWDTENGNALLTLSGHASHVLSVAFSPDGKQLASGSRDNTVRIWNAADGKRLLTLDGQAGHVLSVTFSDDGTRLASGYRDNTIKLWYVKTGEELPKGDARPSKKSDPATAEEE